MDERKADAGKDFVLKDGTKLHSLKDLYGHLSTITDADFRHHVNEQKNDFASWVEHAHGDKYLAQSLRQAKSKEEIQKIIFIALFK
jgi:hypothetical protein